MAIIISTETITENGLDYIVNTYSNGSVVKQIKSDPAEVETDVNPTDSELIAATYLETQHQTALLELQSGL